MDNESRVECAGFASVVDIGSAVAVDIERKVGFTGIYIGFTAV